MACTVLNDSSSLSSRREPSDGQQECSMCGDVGIASELFQCKKCLQRLQHSYCSRSYPNISLDEWMCDWCYSNAAYMESLAQHPKTSAKEKINATKMPCNGNDAFELLLDVALTAKGEFSSSKTVPKQACDCKGNDSTSFSHVPKRQRCTLTVRNKPMLEKWKPLINKTKMQVPSATKGVGRRYKLLSEVLF